MKRLVFVLPLASLAIGLVGAQPDKKPLSYSSEMMPLKVGYKWVYQGVDPKEKISVVVDRVEPIKRRVALPNGNERIDIIDSYVLRFTSGNQTQLEQVLVTEDGIYKYAAAGKEIVPPIKLLKLPVVEGDSWTVNSTSENTPIKGEFVVTKANVELPGKRTLEAWQVKSRDFVVGDGPTARRMEATYWFVSGRGIVKQHVKEGKTDVSMSLEGFAPGN